MATRKGGSRSEKTRGRRSSTVAAHRVASSRRTQDAVSLLRADHKRIRALFAELAQLRKSNSAERLQQIAELACEELEVHTTLEEQIFYPAMRSALKNATPVDEAEVEHTGVKHLMAELRNLSPFDPRYTATLNVLVEQVKRHLREEENEIFPRAKRSSLDLVEMGARLSTLKKSLTGRQDVARVPLPSESDAEGARRLARGETSYRDVALH